jgi:hypothetical protein
MSGRWRNIRVHKNRLPIARYMNVTSYETLACLRVVVGFLGEREQYAWWQSSFFSAQSRAFLAPVFGRTQLLAQTTGVTQAAALVHDERIGVGRVYHLFRLPEDIEQSIHRVLQDAEVGRRIGALVAHKDAALQYLRAEARSAAGGGVGPTRIGDDRHLRDQGHWCDIAAQYVAAFAAGAEVYPYFTDRT